MSRFYVRPEWIRENKIYIRGSEAHHIAHVMRMSAGDKVITFDGTGREYDGIIEKIAAQEVVIRITRSRQKQNPLIRIALAQAIPKKARFDTIVEKATELGVSEIIPVITGRTVVRPDEKRKGSSRERWQRIALEAAKQCGRTDLPQIGKVMEFPAALERAGDYELKIIPCLKRGTRPLKEVLSAQDYRSAIVFIGPEDDFTPQEIARAESAGVVPCSLGPRVLKSDTAGLFVLSCLVYENEEGYKR